MTKNSGRYEFTAQRIVDLLAELDGRLEQRGVSASVFVVGGAALAVARVRDNRVTADIDALSDDDAVMEEAAALAAERGLPVNWLNSAARMWMPPLPPAALTRPDHPGLRVTYADDSFLFATKLVAQRAKDADDVVALATRLGMQRANADQLEAHIRRYYTDPEALRLIVGGDRDVEVRFLAEAAANFLAQHAR
jgi:hypothetical protein